MNALVAGFFEDWLWRDAWNTTRWYWAMLPFAVLVALISALIRKIRK